MNELELVVDKFLGIRRAMAELEVEAYSLERRVSTLIDSNRVVEVITSNGKVHTYASMLVTTLASGDKCYACDGSGMMKYIDPVETTSTCHLCKGTGKRGVK